MTIALGLLAMALLGGVDAATPAPESAPITFETRFVDLKGLAWRETFYHQLQPVARQGASAVWTIDEATREEFLTSLLDDPTANLVQGPRVAAIPDMPAHFVVASHRRMVGHLKRVADGPIGHARVVAFQPEVDEINSGTRVNLSGRRIDQGMLVRVMIHDSRVAALHQARVPSENVAGATPEDKSVKLAALYHVPEIIDRQVAGEWLIPHDSHLIVSLGVHTEADDQGQAQLRERLVILTARLAEQLECPTGPMRIGHPFLGAPVGPMFVPPAMPGPVPVAIHGAHTLTIPESVLQMARETARQQGRPPVDEPPAAGEVEAPRTARLPKLAPPSRTLPRTPPEALVDAEDLPPLPDEAANLAAAEVETSEPRPSPQTRPNLPVVHRDLACDAAPSGKTVKNQPDCCDSPCAALSHQPACVPGPDPDGCADTVHEVPQRAIVRRSLRIDLAVKAAGFGAKPMCNDSCDVSKMGPQSPSACHQATSTKPFVIRLPVVGPAKVEVRTSVSRQPAAPRILSEPQD